MAEKPNIIINIKGGNNQLIPDATSAVQNINLYIDCKEHGTKPADTTNDNASPVSEAANVPNDAELQLATYIGKEHIKEYITRLHVCADCSGIGGIVVDMVNHTNLNEVTAKKGAFIQTIIPFLDQYNGGKSIDNLRKHIRNGLAQKKTIRALPCEHKGEGR